MKDKKSKSIFFAFSMVALLILSSIGSFGISNDTVNEKDTNHVTNLNQISSTVCIKSTLSSRVTSTISTKNDVINTLEGPIVNPPENILVTGEEGDESYPSMVLSGSNILVAYEHKDNSDTYIYLRKSNNFGRSWSEPSPLKVIFEGSEIPVNSPTFCIRPNGKYAYGLLSSPVKDSGIQIFIEIPDITGDKKDIFFADWSDFGFYNFSYPNIVYHYKENAPWITSFIGSTTYEEAPSNNSFMFTIGFLGFGSSIFFSISGVLLRVFLKIPYFSLT